MRYALFLLAADCVATVTAEPEKRDYGYPTRHLGKDSNGESVDMPLVGEGSWLYNSTVAESTVAAAMAVGIRHVDTAFVYANQDGIGAALKTLALKRETYFITTKVAGGLSEENTTVQAEQNLQQLGLDYVDLLLLHFNTPDDSPAMRQGQWKAIEQQYKAGKARAIGVSHFCERHLKDIYEVATVRPMLNQVQYHVGMGTADENATDVTFAYCKEHDIVFMGWSPLCGPCCMGSPDPNCTDNMALITGDLVTQIGLKYNKTGPQVALKWQVQQHIPVIPKSGNPAHLAQNLDMFSWELSKEDMAALTATTTPSVANPGNWGDGTSGDCGIP